MKDLPLEILTNEQMAEADRLAVEMGVPSLTLMENAGRAVADEAEKMVDAGANIVVLCGPGNNGGDGFVAARYLNERGYDIAVYLYGSVDKLKGDAAENAKRWLEMGEVADLGLAHLVLAEAALIVDALFGAGLARPLEGEVGNVVANCNSLRSGGLLAVDVPSGLNGSTGEALGAHVIRADRTVTFFRLKPGHVLYPGRELCGHVALADIGIPDEVIFKIEDGQPFPEKAIRHDIGLNSARIAERALTARQPEQHKYDHGHALVLSGPACATGAARLAARAVLRIGAGLVTVLSPVDALPENAAHLTAIMLKPCGSSDELEGFLADKRNNAVLIGPGFGVGEKAREMVRALVEARHISVVLDADALTSFSEPPHREALFAAIKARNDEASGPAMARVVMTPHEGEFRRLFPALTGSKLERARAASDMTGAVVILKGPDSVIADPSGRAAINTNAPPWLATAGSGDVLAGLITGLLAQGMAAFEAACAAVWIHGDAAARFGPGLIAEDLPELIPDVLRDLYARKQAFNEERRTRNRRRNRDG